MDLNLQLFSMAQDIADERSVFFNIKGPGPGDQDTHLFMKELRARAKEKFGFDYSEQKICGNTQYAVDFYFPTEETIVEIALGLSNPAREFEKDIIKAILAKRSGAKITNLVFISKPGAIKRNKEPGPSAISSWVEKDYGIQVAIKELENMHLTNQ